MGWQYSEKTKRLFMDAVQGKSGTHSGEVPNADGVGEHGSVACGDALKFTFRVERDENDPVNDRIVEAKFLTFGCTSAIAASEALCRIIEERKVTPIEALKITNQDIVEYLEGLPTQKIHCSVMGAEALEAAVFDWAAKRGVDMEALGIKRLSSDENEGRLVCKCFGITEPYLRRKIRELKLKTVDEVTGALKAGGACGSCRGDIQDIINDVWSANPSDSCAVNLCEVPIAEPEPEQKAEAPAAASSDGFIPLATVSTAKDGSVVQNPTFEVKASTAPSGQEFATASPYQRAKLIEKTVEEEIRPVLKRDGGDLEIVDIKDNLVYVQLVGACDGCESASLTIETLVEMVLQDRLDPSIKVIQL
ncbi:MAG: iron-sulfur cluster assembly scaffold protein [Thermoguttaceae bacterium]|nr:iron-sulfur cluster assembly scaffold protein [Thermoguttaceae bacterium]